MANILGRLFPGFRSGGIAREIAQMRDGMAELANQNANLQSLLNISFRNQGGFARFDTINQIDFVRNGYNVSSAVYSIVSDIAQKAASIPLRVYEVVDDDQLKNYNSHQVKSFSPSDIYQKNQLRNKALVPAESDNGMQLQRLLDRPNPDDDPSLFWQTVTGFKLICGNSFIYTPKLDMGADKGKVTEMRIMPSPFTALIVVQGYPPLVIGYELIIDGVTLLRSDEVIHIKYPNYDWSIDGQQLYGLPPLKAAFRTLARMNSGEITSAAMFENGGPSVIIANKSLPSDKIGLEQASKIKKVWNDEYAGNLNRGKVKLMAGDVSAIPLGLSPVDLGIIASMENAFDMIGNVFHVNTVLYNVHVSSNYNNIKELKKDNIVSAVLPERQSHADFINQRIVPAYNTNGKKYFVEPDLSGIAELQPDRTETANWLNTSWWITPNKKLEIQGLEQDEDPNMGKVWMPSGLVPIDEAGIGDVNAIQDMPQDGANDQEDDSKADT